MGDLWDLGVVGLNEDAVIESAVSSGGSNCRVESVAKAHISELTLETQDDERCSRPQGGTAT